MYIIHKLIQEEEKPEQERDHNKIERYENISLVFFALSFLAFCYEVALPLSKYMLKS
jgi:hypothetical protein